MDSHQTPADEQVEELKKQLQMLDTVMAITESDSAYRVYHERREEAARKLRKLQEQPRGQKE